MNLKKVSALGVAVGGIAALFAAVRFYNAIRDMPVSDSEFVAVTVMLFLAVAFVGVVAYYGAKRLAQWATADSHR